MTRKEIILHYSKILESKLSIELEGKEHQYAEWGRADNFLKLSPNSTLVVEIESAQRHPEMNVLKI